MAIGMTFVLLSAGIDLSVGSVMFVTSALTGSLVVRADWPIAVALPCMIACGLLCGLVNGWLITRLRMAPFVVTLSMLFVARGLGLWITETRAINLPDAYRQLATARIAGIPLPVWMLALILALAHLILTRTAFGRQLYAVGEDQAAARKAGISVDRILLRVYMISGVFAAIGGMIALAQLAAVSPNLGQGRELDVIAAAVLGGTSLFGGRGTALGAVLGAVLVETVRNGLNVTDADPYIYPVITGAIIFVAVLIDNARHQRLAELRRRKIRTLTTSSPG
jgi:ribose transport system permease protein